MNPLLITSGTWGTVINDASSNSFKALSYKYIKDTCNVYFIELCKRFFRLKLFELIYEF